MKGHPGEGPVRQAEGSRYRVLVVDDHEGFRNFVCELLLDHSKELDVRSIAEASDGTATLVLAQAFRPDVVIMDVSMPRRGGLDALAHLKALMPDLRAILMTAEVDWDIQQRGRGLRAFDVLSKGDIGRRLVGTMQLVLQQRDNSRAPGAGSV